MKYILILTIQSDSMSGASAAIESIEFHTQTAAIEAGEKWERNIRNSRYIIVESPKA